MTPFATRVLLLVAVAAPLAVVFYRVGHRFADRGGAFQSLGESLLRQKDRALRQWPLNRYAGLLREGRMFAASSLLAVLILAKSLASLLLGPLAIVWLPPACLTIPPLGRAFARAQQRSGASWRRWMENQTALQLTSHLAAAAVGASAWWGFVSGEGSLWDVTMQSPGTTGAFLTLSVVVALVAGWYEASGHARYRLV